MTIVKERVGLSGLVITGLYTRQCVPLCVTEGLPGQFHHTYFSPKRRWRRVTKGWPQHYIWGNPKLEILFFGDLGSSWCCRHVKHIFLLILIGGQVITDQVSCAQTLEARTTIGVSRIFTLWGYPSTQLAESWTFLWALVVWGVTQKEIARWDWV